MSLGVNEALLTSAPGEEQERGLLEVANTFRPSWIALIVLLVAGVALLASYYRLVSPVHHAHMIVVPVQPVSTGMAPVSASQLRNTLNFVGLGGNGEISVIEKLRVIAGSEVLAARLQDKHRLLQRLFPDDWDQTTNSWRQPAGFANEVRKWGATLLGVPLPYGHDLHELSVYLQKRVIITKRYDQDIVTLEYSNRSPAEAGGILSLVFSEAEQILIENRSRQLSGEIDFLQRRAGQEPAVDLRTSYVTLLSTRQIESGLLGSGGGLFETLIPPTVSPPEWAIGPVFFSIVMLLAAIIGSCAVGAIARR